MPRTDAVVGLGQIGRAIAKVFERGEHSVIGYDLSFDLEPQGSIVDVLHICIPYSDPLLFAKEVDRYNHLFHPTHTVIHSTVPVGTSYLLNCLHSPVVGLHPNMETSLLTFTKFIGGEKSGEVADHFRSAGFKVYLFKDSQTTELMKLLSTTFYGLCIEYTKDIDRLCDQWGIPFEAWTLWIENYNRGYEELGYREYMRPNLVPMRKKIGGHCIRPNLDLLQVSDEERNDFVQLIQRRNFDDDEEHE